MSLVASIFDVWWVKTVIYRTSGNFPWFFNPTHRKCVTPTKAEADTQKRAHPKCRGGESDFTISSKMLRACLTFTNTSTLKNGASPERYPSIMMIKVTCDVLFKLQGVRRPRGKGKGCFMWSFRECLPSCSGWVNKGVKKGSSYSVSKPRFHVARQGQKQVQQATGFIFVLFLFSLFCLSSLFFLLFFKWYYLGNHLFYPSYQNNYKPLLLIKTNSEPQHSSVYFFLEF